MTTQASSCPRCGDSFPTELEAREFEGICPRCLATLAVDGDSDIVPSAASEDPHKLAAKDPPPLKRGATFHGMEVLELIGQGGMGVVYKARQIDLDRIVALKILSPRLASDGEFPRRFNREAQALASLDHANIVRVYDVGREGDLYFIVMEHVDGVNLRDLLVQKKLAPEQALRVVPQLCDALEYAHSKGVIHRDIKPENILLARSGAAKIADFGLAKIVKDENAATKITQTNVVMGTADYMAPEQRSAGNQADHRADIYSLGVVFYELLTGELPVGRFEPPSRRMRVDVRVDDVVLRALEKDPERRYQRASHMGRDVDQIASSADAPVTDCPIIDLETGKRIGTSPGLRFALRTVACPVIVSGWEKREIGVQVQGDYQFEARAAMPLLQSQVDTRSVEVYMPRGAELDVVAAEGNVETHGLVGHLTVRIPDGNLTVADHKGSLRVHAGTGQVEVAGLKSEYFEIRARNGSVTLTDLELSRGRGQVETESGSVVISPTSFSSFRYYLDARAGIVSQPSGQVGGGAGWLTVRSAGGSITLVPPLLGTFPIEKLRAFLRQLTPRQVEKLGVYAIVNSALFLFFTFVAGTAIPAVIIAIFWGMGLALDLWKTYLRRTHAPGQSLSEMVSPLVGKVMKLVPTPAAEPPSPPDKPRVSSLAVLGALGACLSAMVAAGAFIALSVEENAAGIGISARDAGELRMGAAIAGMVVLALGLPSFVLGAAASSHVTEARGALKGRGAAHVAVFLSLLALLTVYGYVQPRLTQVQRIPQEARATAARFVAALDERRIADARALLSDELQSELDEAELRARVDAALGKKPALLKGILWGRVKTWGADEHELEAHFRHPHGGYSLIEVKLKAGPRWRLTDVRNLMHHLER